jgi:hypothetical protein
MISDADIVEIMNSEHDLEKCCHMLIERANMNGGKDNVTATLVRVGKVIAGGLPRLAKIAGIPIAFAACAAVALYLFLSSSVQELAPLQDDVPPLASPEQVSGDMEPRMNEKAGEMLALATAEIENGNLREARTIVEQLLGLCRAQDCSMELSDVENPRLRDMIANSQNVIWIQQLKAANEKLERQESALKKYAPTQFESSIVTISKAEVAFENRELFRALRLLDDANKEIDEALEICNDIKADKKTGVRNVLIKAELEIAKIDAYKGKSYKDIILKREIEEAKLTEAKRRLEAEDYEDSLRLANEVLRQSKQILAEASSVEKSLKAIEQQKRDAAAIAGKVAKKWNYLKSEQFEKVGTALSNQEYKNLAAHHSAFEAQLNTTDYAKIASSGNELLGRADLLIQNTAAALQLRIAEAEAALHKKESSGEDYDEADLTLAASVLAETKVLADMQFLSKAFEQLKDLEELIESIKKKEPPAPVVEATDEKKPTEKQFSPLELKKIVLASEETAILETYLQRCIELLNQNKTTRAKSLLQEHSKKKFEKISSLLAEEHKDLSDILDGAYGLCFREDTVPEKGNVEKALAEIKRLKKKIEGIVAANQG